MQLRWLGNDSSVRVPLFNDGTGAGAGVLLVCNCRDDHVSTQPPFLCSSARCHDCSKPAFHLVCRLLLEKKNLTLSSQLTLQNPEHARDHVYVEQQLLSAVCGSDRYSYVST